MNEEEKNVKKRGVVRKKIDQRKFIVAPGVVQMKGGAYVILIENRIVQYITVSQISRYQDWWLLWAAQDL